MKKVLFLVPHLSTGGMPQYTYDLMRKIINDVEVYCVEYSFISPTFVVQRNRIIDLLGDRFFCLGDDKLKLLNIIKTINPDIIHLQEVPEYFVSHDVASQLYDKERNYVIVETSHDSSFSVSNKRFFPDHFALISQYQKNEFSKLKIPIDFVESDIEYKERQDRTTGLQNLGLDPNLKHVVNVGLFTPRKNQAEAIEYARKLQEYPIQFHFIGNQADNFRNYWEPLIQNLPPNVKVWGERSDVDSFYSCMDMMLFTSRGTGKDKETSPLVIREAIGYNLPSLIFDLPVYLGMYDKHRNIKYMNTDDLDFNSDLILEVLGVNKNSSDDDQFSFSLDLNENKVFISSKHTIDDELTVIIRDKLSGHAMYRLHTKFLAGVVYWVQPAQKWYIEKNSYIDFFQGYLIDIYDSKNNLIKSGEASIQPKLINPNLPSIIHNKLNTSWMSFREIFFEGIYDHFDFRNVKTALDVGANDGLFTDYLMKRGVKKIISVEPDTRSTEFLSKKYDGEDRVHVLPYAMTPTDCELQIYGAEDCSTLSSSKPSSGLTKEMKVRGISLQTLLEETGIGNIDLIKIDIEGAEYDLIDSIQMGELNKIKYFIIELHPTTRTNMVKVKEKFENFNIQIRDHGNDNIILSFDSLQDGSHVTLFGINKKLIANHNIKAVQFLLNGEFEKQEKSIENISRIEELGIEYVKHFNDIYTDLPPVTKSNRPHDVSIELKPNSLTPAHYGCYDSFRTAVLSEFDTDLDYFIVMEGDAKIQDYTFFREKLVEAISLIEKHNLGFVSFGGIYDLEMGVLQSNVVEDLSEDFFVCDKIIGCQFLIFPASSRQLIKDILRKEKWDALDIYLNNVSHKYGIRVGVSRKTLVTQYDGISTIDSVVKQFKEFSV